MKDVSGSYNYGNYSSDTKQYLIYELIYQVGEKKYTERITSEYTPLIGLKQGDSIEIYYDKTNPNNVYIPGYSVSNVLGMQGIQTIGLLAFGIGMTVICEFYYRIHRKNICK